MRDCIAALNIGSSSIKLDVYDAAGLAGPSATPFLGARLSGLGREQTSVEWRGDTPCRELAPGAPGPALSALLTGARTRLQDARLVAVGHRIVHGGPAYARPVRLDDDALDALAEFIPLAPQHQAANLAGVRAAALAWPGIPQVGCFDTAFHRTQSHLAGLFGIPGAYAREGVVRYGFHGLSYAHIAGVLPHVFTGRPHRRTIVAHLGNGASMCALLDGRSIATTMGFTTLAGLPMGRRCGDLDPGLVLYLIEQRGMKPAEVREMLYERSGLLGLSELSDDMRVLLASDSAGAHLAIDYYCYWARREIGSLAAALGGLDAIVFTGGVGENAAPIRDRILDGTEWLGVRLGARSDRQDRTWISAPDSPVAVAVIPANEEREIARNAHAALGA